ncbi:MAG: T9SS type A sorting domain-containing protein [Candidatus Marinimicrobia bacterium]|nr:T9SS type A sorting domain-containing protein [Candidatus Neomarinimicrobiota bacterium]
MTALFQNIGKRAKISYLVVFSLLCLSFSSLMAQEYGFIHITDGTGTNSVGTTWTNVGAGNANDFVESTSSTYWSYSNNVLTAANNPAVEGNYCIKYSLSFNAVATVWYMGISIDGADPVEPVFTRSISNDRKDTGNMSGILMVSITQGQTVEMVVKSSLAASDFTPVYAQLSVCPAAQNPENLYSGMHIHTTTTYTNLGIAFAKLTGFTSIPESNGWTFGTSDLIANEGSDGLYYMSYSVSFTGGGTPTAPGLFTFELVKNDVNGSTNIMTARSTNETDIGNVSAGGLVSITAGDIISLEGKASNSTYDPSIVKATISMFKMGDTAPNANGGMVITSDQTVTIGAQNTWTTVGDYTIHGANLWGLSSNIFTINSTNAYGYYYLEFSTSLSTTNTVGDVVELGVFVGNSLNSHLTVKRRLSSNTDVGAVCGIGLFKVDGPDSTITLKINNTTSSNDLTIKKSMVGFSQIRYVSSDTPLPITLSDFTAKQTGSGVKLDWQTASETNNAKFLIYRDGEVIASIDGGGTTSEPNYYTIIDNYIVPGKTYTYVLADVSFSNEEVKHVEKVVTITINEGRVIKDYNIGYAYPNPFNPSTVIPVNLSTEARVIVNVFDLAGNRVLNMYEGTIDEGSHELHIDGRNLSTGIYLVHFNIEGISTIRKISLMK